MIGANPSRYHEAVHLAATYYLPSWQGGDVRIARCRLSGSGWTSPAGEPPELTEHRGFVTCPCCRSIMALGHRPRASDNHHPERTAAE